VGLRLSPPAGQPRVPAGPALAAPLAAVALLAGLIGTARLARDGAPPGLEARSAPQQSVAPFGMAPGDCLNQRPGLAWQAEAAEIPCNQPRGAHRARLTAGLAAHAIFPPAAAWLTGQRAVCCLLVSPRQALRSSLLSS
jgi:hypothetical protein